MNRRKAELATLSQKSRTHFQKGLSAQELKQELVQNGNKITKCIHVAYANFSRTTRVSKLKFGIPLHQEEESLWLSAFGPDSANGTLPG